MPAPIFLAKSLPLGFRSAAIPPAALAVDRRVPVTQDLEGLTAFTALVAILVGCLIGNLMLIVLNLPLIGIWVKVLTIPKDILYAGILVFATLGAYSLHQSWVDLLTLYVFGLLGFAMRRWDIPVGPAVIGLILGPLAETQFRRTLSISQGDATVFFTQPISAGFLAVTAALVIVPWAVRRWRRR